MNSYFFDTYAFFEILVGNPNYLQYSRNIKIVTSQLNLMEFYYLLLKAYPKEIAIQYFKRYEEFIIPVNNETLIAAMDFRRKHRKKGYSYVDCIGYLMAKELGVKFLTGDKEFKDMQNVRFIK